MHKHTGSPDHLSRTPRLKPHTKLFAHPIFDEGAFSPGTPGSGNLDGDGAALTPNDTRTNAAHRTPPVRGMLQAERKLRRTKSDSEIVCEAEDAIAVTFPFELKLRIRRSGSTQRYHENITKYGRSRRRRRRRHTVVAQSNVPSGPPMMGRAASEDTAAVTSHAAAAAAAVAAHAAAQGRLNARAVEPLQSVLDAQKGGHQLPQHRGRRRSGSYDEGMYAQRQPAGTMTPGRNQRTRSSTRMVGAAYVAADMPARPAAIAPSPSTTVSSESPTVRRKSSRRSHRSSSSRSLRRQGSSTRSLQSRRHRSSSGMSGSVTSTPPLSTSSSARKDDACYCAGAAASV